MKSQILLLEGKILTKRLNNDTCTIYSGKDIFYFNLPKKPGYDYDIISWMNSKDLIIGAEYKKSPRNYTLKSDLIILSPQGELIEKLYETKPNEHVCYAFSSYSDSLLLLITRYDNKEKIDNLFISPITLIIFDLNKKIVIQRIEDFCSRINFELVESPWSPDENFIVYSILDKYNSILIEKNDNSIIQTKPGIYIYNIHNKSIQVISNNGHNAVWSPNNDFIAYMFENEIRLYNISDSNTKVLYEAESFERVKDMHWSPDGKYVFVTCPKYYNNNNFLFDYNEKLIRIADGKQVNFHKISKGIVWYTWKK